MDVGSSRGGGISGVGNSGEAKSGMGIAGVGNSGVSNSGNSSINMMGGVGDNGSGHGFLDDRFAGNSHGVRNIVGGVTVDGGGNLNDVLLVDGDIIGDLNTTLNQDGVLDVVDLNLLLDDGGVVGNRSLQDSGDRDGEMGRGRLQDPGGISRHEVSLSIMNLLGNNWGRLMDRGMAWALLGGCVGGGGGRSHIVNWVWYYGSSLQRVRGRGGGNRLGVSRCVCHGGHCSVSHCYRSSTQVSSRV